MYVQMLVCYRNAQLRHHGRGHPGALLEVVGGARRHVLRPVHDLLRDSNIGGVIITIIITLIIIEK